ncbi:MAG: metal-dependent transcriptional regulator [Thermoplasmata archaeon]|nr:MAG: metal-dependent transcriptional regulator [Thermoplasmata archaeon]
MEDYLEAIYDLEMEKGYATTGEISSHLNINPASVTEMIQKLGRLGFVTYKKYRGVALTLKGRKAGESIKKRHDILSTFLMLLGIDKETAERDACKIEHDVDPITLDRLEKFVQFIQDAPHDPKWLKHFRYYIKTGEHPKCNKV